MKQPYDKIASVYEQQLNKTKYRFDAVMYTRTGNPGIIQSIDTTVAKFETGCRKNFIGLHFYFGEKTQKGYPLMFACTKNTYINMFDVPQTENLLCVHTHEYVQRRTCNAILQFIKENPTYILITLKKNAHILTLLPQIEQELYL